MKIVKKYTELSDKEKNSYHGGGEAARLLGLGAAMAVVGGYGGPLAMAYAAYNYFKD